MEESNLEGAHQSRIVEPQNKEEKKKMKKKKIQYTSKSFSWIYNAYISAYSSL